MKIAFLADPLSTFKIYKDSTFAMMREAARRGHAIYAFEQRDMVLEEGEVTAVVTRIHLTGEADYLLHVAVADPEHLRDVVLDRLTLRPEVAQVTTSLMFEHHRSRPQPLGRRARPRR